MKEKIIFCTVTALLIFGFYSHTLFYDIRAYDELAIFKETYLPVCNSFSEMLELISLLGLHRYFEASNTLYSNIVSLRSNPFTNFLQLFTQLIFQKNVILYHLYSLILHVINSVLIFFILDKTSLLFFKKDANSHLRLLLMTILTILWATHPVNVESVLLTTNSNILIGYTASLVTFYLFLSSRQTVLNSVLLFIFSLFALFTAEFHFMIPVILVVYSLVLNIHQKMPFSQSLKASLKQALPVIIATFIFLISFLASHTSINLSNNQSLDLTFQRILWLSPQVFFHFIKLFIFPVKLSIDQSLLLNLSKTLFSPYVIACFLFVLLSLVLSIFSFIKANKKFPFLFVIFIPFLLSLLPFLHIVAPLYNLASERYLYFPSFMIVFGIAHVLFFITNNANKKNICYVAIALVAIVSLTYGSRAFIRTLDWKNNFTLFNSAIKTANNPLHKASRYKRLILQDKILLDYPERYVDPKYQKLAIKHLKEAISLYKKEVDVHQKQTPKIVKFYGLDPKTLLAKSSYLLAQSDFTLNNDHKKALQIIKPYADDLASLDSAAISFYAAHLFYNNMPNKAEEVLNKGLKLFPYSTRIVIPLCDLIYIKHKDLNRIENYCLSLFKYFPYDPYVQLSLAKTYKLKGDSEKYAYYAYIYGLRNHSIEALKGSYNEYLKLNKNAQANKVMERIAFLTNRLKGNNET